MVGIDNPLHYMRELTKQRTFGKTGQSRPQASGAGH